MNIMKFISVSVNVYWDTAASFHLHVICGYFGPVTAEVSSCNRMSDPQPKNI